MTIKEKLRQAKFMVLKGFGGLHVDAVISTKDPFISGTKFSGTLHGCVRFKAQEIPLWTRNKPQSAHSGHTAQGQGSSTERR